MLWIRTSYIGCLLSLLLAHQFSVFDFSFEIIYLFRNDFLLCQIVYDWLSPFFLRVFMCKHTFSLSLFIYSWKLNRRHEFQWVMFVNWFTLNIIIFKLFILKRICSSSHEQTSRNWDLSINLGNPTIIAQIKTLLLKVLILKTIFHLKLLKTDIQLLLGLHLPSVY